MRPRTTVAAAGWLSLVLGLAATPLAGRAGAVEIGGCEAADMAAATAIEGRRTAVFDPVTAGPLDLAARVTVDCAGGTCAIRTDVAARLDGAPTGPDTLAPIGMDPATGAQTGSEVMLSAPGNAASGTFGLDDPRVADAVRQRGWTGAQGRAHLVDTQRRRIGPIAIRRRVALACGPSACDVVQRTVVSMGYDDDGRFSCGDVARRVPTG